MLLRLQSLASRIARRTKSTKRSLSEQLAHHFRELPRDFSFKAATMADFDDVMKISERFVEEEALGEDLGVKSSQLQRAVEYYVKCCLVPDHHNIHTSIIVRHKESGLPAAVRCGFLVYNNEAENPHPIAKPVLSPIEESFARSFDANTILALKAYPYEKALYKLSIIYTAPEFRRPGLFNCLVECGLESETFKKAGVHYMIAELFGEKIKGISKGRNDVCISEGPPFMLMPDGKYRDLAHGPCYVQAKRMAGEAVEGDAPVVECYNVIPHWQKWGLAGSL